MQYKCFDGTWMLRIDAGEEITQCLLSLCEKENIRLAEISAIGAVDHAVIGVYDLQSQSYCRQELTGFMEIASLLGSVTAMDGKPYIHLHASLADQQHRVYAGHVIELRVGATCEMFVRTIPGEVRREKDEKLGINLWEF